MFGNRRRMFGETSIVPKEYQLLDYLSCDGQQYIDTDYQPEDGDGFEMTMYVPSSVGTISQWPLAIFPTGANQCQFGFYWYKPGAADQCIPRFFYTANYYSNLIVNSGTMSTADNWVTIREYLTSDNYLHREMNDQQLSPIYFSGTLSIDHNIHLFALVNANGTVSPSFQGRCSNVKIYGIDKAVLYDFYPVKRKADNVYGFYDIVNDVFYTNQGTGDFTPPA